MLESATASAVAKIFDMKTLRPLKHPVSGTTLILVNFGKWATSATSFDDFILSVSSLLERPFTGSSVPAEWMPYAIVELSEFGFSHLWQLTYSRIKFPIKAAAGGKTQLRLKVMSQGNHFPEVHPY